MNCDLGQSASTTSEDYSSTYYNDAHLGGYDNYVWDNPEWQQFFLVVAERLVGAVNPRTVLDVGCARGLLVQALSSRGIDAQGVDISEHAIESAHPDVRDRLSTASATKPFAGRYDLITCIEVLEHMSPLEAQLAIDNMGKATDRILFSSSPGDFDEPTHVNTHPTAAWAAWFAERGFFRRTDVDLSFLTPWAVLFERSDLTLHGLTQRYEHQYAVLNAELLEKRSALLESHRRIGSLNEQLEGQAGGRVNEQVQNLQEQLQQQAQLVHRWEAEVLDARHRLLTSRDHVVGKEAEATRLSRENARLTKELLRARTQLTRVRTQLREARRRANRLASRMDGMHSQDRPHIARRIVGRLRAGSR